MMPDACWQIPAPIALIVVTNAILYSLGDTMRDHRRH
jgi:hypothetical protein